MATAESNYVRVTEEAKKKQELLEQIGYLHSNYERFQEISNYDNVAYVAKIKQLAKKIIEQQIAREREIYKQLGVKDAKELSNKFLTDTGLQQFITNEFENIYAVITKALGTALDDTSPQQKLNKNTKKEVEKVIEKAFDDALKGQSEEYQANLQKVLHNGGLGKEMVSTLQKISNRDKKGKMKTAGQIAAGAFSQWKGSLLEQCLAMFISQLVGVQGVEVTGSSLDSFGKYIKSDVTAFTETMTIGFSAKNYKMKQVGKSWELTRKLTLHSGGSFESFLNRLESLRNADLDTELALIGKTFRSDNYYYHLINEAVQKSTFDSSEPAQDFMTTIKELAAAWFGAQLVTDTKEGNGGQMVDFLVVGNKGFIPMSALLLALQEQSTTISTNISSKASIDEDSIYEEKINSPYTSEGLYSNHVRNIGFYSGQEVYSGIKVSEIKLNLILKQFMG